MYRLGKGLDNIMDVISKEEVIVDESQGGKT